MNHQYVSQWLKIPLLHIPLCLYAAFSTLPCHAERLKDIATVQGIRNNQLMGYGLLMGLDGTGDQTTQTPFTTQALKNMLTQLGISLPDGASMQLKNVAAVMVTATLPAFAQPGQPLDVTVSSMGNAKSLRGGTLLMTPLKGADGQVYAVAQGNVVVGAGNSGGKSQPTHLLAGRIPSGAIIERGVENPFNNANTINFELSNNDFEVAQRVADEINKATSAGTATPLDGRIINVALPRDPADKVRLMAKLENLSITASQPPAKIVVNARTGSVIMNRTVTLEACSIAHGTLSVSVKDPANSAAAPPDPNAKAEGGNLIQLKAGAKLADVVKALNTLGASPNDLIAILQAMKTAGALKAELEII
jgi:flagellar P-ring protein precursor FlgI